LCFLIRQLLSYLMTTGQPERSRKIAHSKNDLGSAASKSCSLCQKKEGQGYGKKENNKN